MGATKDGRRQRTARTAKRWLLQMLLASVIINAALGLWALLIGDFGQTEAKVLVTSLLVTATTTSVLANSVPITQRLLWPVPVGAAASAVFGFVLLIGLVWTERDGGTPMRLAASALTLAAAATVASLLRLIDLPPRYELVRVVNHVFLGALVVIAWWGIWDTLGGNWYGRLVGTTSVLAAATTLAVPVLSRFEPKPPIDTVARLTRPAVVVDSTATLRSVVDQLAQHGVDIAVVRNSHSVSGVVTATDLLWAMHDGAEVDEVQVADVMSVDPLVVSPQTTVERAADLMSDSGVRQLLVLGDKLRVVSMTDVLRSLRSGSSR